MSNTVLAPSATQLTVSNGASDWDQDAFNESASRAASRAIKKESTTRERRMINRNRLIASVCADYRAHFAAVYGKTDRLPTAIFEKIEIAVDKCINDTLGQVNSQNAIAYQRGFYHNSRDMEVTERVRLTGENKISLKEQLFAINIFINQQQKKIDGVPAAIDREKLQEMKQSLMRMQLTKSFIDGEIASQAKATTPAA